jgi:3-methyl-2-oxobutanoate hydroxymethyltransferase
MSSTKAAAVRAMKGREKIGALTAYDFGMGRILDQLGVPFLLVGDSLGMVVLGYEDTTKVTMAEMEHHVRAVARAKPKGLLVADLPFHSYETVAQALDNARRLVEAGAEAIKAEGASEILPQIKAILSAGIPFCGHLGMLPQHVREEGGYHIKGKTQPERDHLLAEAKALERAGAFAIVLELVASAVAEEITRSVSIPTIGIGSGKNCDGQILVTSDLWGTSPDFIPKHVKARMEIPEQMRSAILDWKKSL